MKKENGVTIIALVITVVIMLIIATITTSTSIDLYRITTQENFVAKMKIIQEKVNLIKEEYKTWEPTTVEKTLSNYYTELGFSAAGSCAYKNEFKNVLNILAQEVSEGKITSSWSHGDENIANYYYFAPSDLESKLGIKDMDDVYVIINFNTGNVVSKDGVILYQDSAETLGTEAESRYIFRQYDAPTGSQLIYENQTQEKIQLRASVIENYGSSKKVKVEVITIKNNKEVINSSPDIYKMYYRIYTPTNNTNPWLDITEFRDYKTDGKTATFTIDKAGRYEFKILDISKNEYKMAIDDHLDITLCNPPILLDGMNPICWDGDDIKEVSDIYSPEWYDYDNTAGKMANAETSDGSIWVWVPRMGYTQNSTTGERVYGFVSGISKTSFDEKIVFDNVFEAFSDNGEVTGIWVGKFAAHIESSKMIMDYKNKAFSITNATTASTNCTTNIDNAVKSYSHLMTSNERKAVLYSTSLFEIGEQDIAINTSNYPGNSNYINNKNQSSTHSVYGIYDLRNNRGTNGGEITSSSGSATGTYRAVLIVK